MLHLGDVELGRLDQLVGDDRGLLGQGRVAELPGATGGVTGDQAEHGAVTLPGDEGEAGFGVAHG